MATLDLKLPQGSNIPPEISVVSGSLFFRGEAPFGLQGTDGVLSRFQINDTLSDGDIYIDFGGVSLNKFLRLDFRYQDADNHLRVIFTDNTQDDSKPPELRFQEVVNGSVSSTEIDIRPYWGDYAQYELYRFGVIFSGTSVSLVVHNGTDFQTIHSHTDNRFTTQTAAFIQQPDGKFYIPTLIYASSADGGTVTPDPDPEPEPEPTPIPALNLPKLLPGYKRQFTKLGQLFDKPSTMPDDREYWFRPFLTAGIAGFPSDKYPVAAVSSSNHATGNGGIYLRVYEEKGLYDLNDRDSWYEWPEVSNLAEFNHVTKKTNPIFTYTGRDSQQTETPQIFVRDDGSVVMYFHNSSVDLSDFEIDPDCQTTMYTIAASFPDFGSSQPANFIFSPWRLESDGHTGYFRGGNNTFRGVPFDYIGNSLVGGNGTGSVSRQYVVGNDVTDFERYTIASRVYGALRDYVEVPSNKVLVVELLHDAKREGAYNRIMGNLKFETGGGAATEGSQFEVLMDDYLNIVSRPNIFVERGLTGEWDASEISNYDEISYGGKDYGFYNTTLSNGESGIGIGVVEDVPHNWELHYTGGGRTELLVSASASNAIAPNWTFSQAPNAILETPSTLHPDKYNYTEMVLPQNGDISTAEYDTGITLSEHDIIDIYFVRIGKKTGDGILVEFGLTDDFATLANAIHYRWPASNGSATASDSWMYADVSIDGAVTNNRLNNHIGQASNWKTADSESATSKHEVGFRIIPSQNRLIMLEGVSETDVFDITGFDYDAVLKLFIKANIATTASVDSGVLFDTVKVITYTDESIAVPAVPTISTSKTASSVTVSSNTVSGATGYKYFLDNQSNETGTFTDLEPETTYTVYARASNALGDSAPSAIQTVTTDAAGTPDTTAPVVTNNGPATLTLTVGDSYTPDFSTNEGTLNISNPVDTSTAGTYTVTATATDAADNVGSATQTVIVGEVPNTAPTANAGTNQSVAAGVNVVLDGSNSTDGDGAIVNYLWEQVSGPSVTVSNADQSTASFISPSEASTQILSFRLTVTDNDGDSSSVTTTVTVAAVPDVADPLDETLSFINIKSRVGIEDDRQALDVVSLYQYSDNFILCEIVNKGGSTLEPALFSEAEYRLTDQKGNDVAKLDLTGGIKAVGNKFFIHVNSGILNNSHKGSLRHQFVVWNQAGYKLPPIFSGSINIIPVLEPTA